MIIEVRSVFFYVAATGEGDKGTFFFCLEKTPTFFLQLRGILQHGGPELLQS